VVVLDASGPVRGLEKGEFIAEMGWFEGRDICIEEQMASKRRTTSKAGSKDTPSNRFRV